MRLFCFPYAGGTAAAFGRWQDELPATVEVCALELPGRRHRRREQPFRRLDALVEAAGEALEPHLDLPFAFFGHSMGSLVAFELARHLRRHGSARPEALFLSGAAAPHLSGARRSLFDRPDAELLTVIRAFGGTPDEILAEPSILEVYLPVLRADFELFETYRHRPEPLLDLPTYLYGGERDDRVSPARLSAWNAVTRVVSVELFPGGHFYLNEQRRALTASIGRELAGLLRRSAA